MNNEMIKALKENEWTALGGFPGGYQEFLKTLPKCEVQYKDDDGTWFKLTIDSMVTLNDIGIVFRLKGTFKLPYKGLFIPDVDLRDPELCQLGDVTCAVKKSLKSFPSIIPVCDPNGCSTCVAYITNRDQLTKLIEDLGGQTVERVPLKHTKERAHDLYEATADAIKYLNDHYHPRVKLIITVNSAEVVSGELMSYTDEFIKG